ncbi:hypothetical protein, partial [Paenibacillus sp. 1-18]|uniref:hypothetical protein n=1 Tax=Paenibacillus sp. 1-18 TaxID=1333846 RepID=UPI00046F6C75
PPSAGVTPSVGATLSAGVAPTAGGNNSYKTKPIELLNYAKNNIKIDSYVFKTYLDFVVQSKFSSIHPYKIVVPFLYRVLLESAIQHWIDWFRKPENQSKFRSGSDGLIGGVNVSNLLNTPRETSVVNEKKLNEIKEILKVIKDNHACSFIRECFRGIPSSRPTSFINDINSVVHGSIVEIDIEKLKTYDDYVLMYLKAMSYSMNL